jgi:release factor glutamine methyltransferase
MTLQQALNDASTRIARRDAQVLLGHVLKQDTSWLLAHTGDTLPEAGHSRFLALVARRAEHEPLQYLTGAQEFYGLPLRVTRDTLIPRPETEHLVEAVLAWASTQPRPLRVLDVGTGTGAIAITLAKHLPHANVTACDLSAAALAVAKDNASRNGVAIDFAASDLLEAFASEIHAGLRFDIIASNPPYIPTGDAPEMQPDVRDYEPHSALFAGDDGLAVYRRLVPQAHTALRDGGLLAMEIGFGQSGPLAALLKDWTKIRFIDDYAGIPRVVLAIKPTPALHRD